MILENPIYLLLAVFALPLAYQFYRAESFRGRFITASYVLILLTLSLAAASPQIQQETSQIEEDRLVLLQDDSKSMTVVERDLGLEEVTVETRTIASGNSSPLEQSMMAVLEPNTTYLVDSDMQDDTDFSDLETATLQAGSELNFVERDMMRESSVKIEGPSTAVPNTEASYTVGVQHTVDHFQRPDVYVNGEEVELEEVEDDTFGFDYEFSNKGSQRITAELRDEDQYSENNEYFKSVDVIERPEILVIGEEGGIGDQINEYFELSYRQELPEDLSGYYSILLKENIQASENLEQYLNDGNGLVYTGNSEEHELDVVPVQEHDYSQSTDNPKIIVGIDNSQGATPGDWTGCEPQESLEGSKQLGASLINSLYEQRPESIVGVFAYNRTVWSFGEPQPLSNTEHRERLLGSDTQGGILSIPVCGPPHHIKAIQASQEMIDESPGNVVLITSGNMPSDKGIFWDEASDDQDLDHISERQYELRALEEASKFSDNVSLHTVAVGENPDKEFLEELAEEGNGDFYDGPEEFYALENRFRGGGGSDRKSIAAINANHFITRGLGQLTSTITDVEDVKAKPSARTLVQTSDDRPFLTTWRYGLGRVAAFSGDGSDLQNVMGQEPILFSRTLNWAIGHPERKNDETVTVESARMGEEVELTASYDAEGFVQVSDDSYRATVRPESTGFHDYFGNEFAYNYRPEIQDLGYRTDVMERLASSTGGEVYTEDEVEAVQDDVKERTVERFETVSLTPYLLVATLIIFLIQVGYRKSKGWM